MKAGIGRSGMGPGARVVLAAVALLMALPTSSAVLCIAPGCHVAMENLWDGCCGSGEHKKTGTRFAGNEPAAAFGHPGCIDLYVLAEEPGRIQRSYEAPASGTLAAEASLTSLPAAPPRGSERPAPPETPELSSPPPSVPLRC